MKTIYNWLKSCDLITSAKLKKQINRDKMKKIFFILSILVLVSSCNNRPVDFDDFEFQGVYFPYQTPVRTLILGDEVIGDNTIDIEHAFSIGVSIGGMYNNDMDREVAVELAPDLAENII